MNQRTKKTVSYREALEYIIQNLAVTIPNMGISQLNHWQERLQKLVRELKEKDDEDATEKMQDALDEFLKSLHRVHYEVRFVEELAESIADLAGLITFAREALREATPEERREILFGFEQNE